MPNVFLADDHLTFLDGLVALLNTVNDISICGTATTGTEVLESLKKKEPDVVVLDINMPGLNGLDAARLIKEQYPKVKILILSMHQEYQYINAALEAGATGYILKNTGGEEFCEAIRAVYRGETFLSNQATESLVSGIRSPKKASNSSPNQVDLSSRELEVLRLIAKEFTSPEIANELNISEHTVKSHRKNLLSKIQVKNTAGLVLFAAANDLLDPFN